MDLCVSRCALVDAHLRISIIIAVVLPVSGSGPFVSYRVRKVGAA
jgi:hypothetical protein